ncbi:MAG: ABC transporter substrate-binding protein [Bacillota bacterium]
MIQGKRWMTLASVAVIVALSLACCGGGEAAENTNAPIKIGIAAPLTGIGADWGFYITSSAKLAADEINAQGGVNGRKIELYIEDDQSQPTVHVSAIKKLIHETKVDVILGSGVSLCVLAGIPVIEQYEVPLLVTCASAPKISKQGSKWMMAQLPVTEDYCLPMTAAYGVRNKGLKKVGIIYENSDWGKEPAEAARKRIGELGGTVTAFEAFNPTDTDFSAQLTKIKFTNPDMLLTMSVPKHTAIIVRQARQVGLGVPIYMNQANSSMLFLETAGQYAEGCWSTVYWSPFATDEASKKFVEAYKAATGKNAVQACASTYDGMYLLAEAIKKVGTDKAKLRDYIRNIGSFKGVCGTYNIDPKDGHNLMDLTVTRVEDGVWKIVDKTSW